MCTQEGFGLCVCSTYQAVQRQAAQDLYGSPKTLCGIQPFIQSSFIYYTWHLWFASSAVLSFKPEEGKKKKKAMGTCLLNLPPLTETSSKPHSLLLCVLLVSVQIVLITKDLLVVNFYLSM